MRAAVPLALMLLLAACAGTPFPRYEPLPGASADSVSSDDLLQHQPRPLSFVERVTVRHCGRDFSTSLCGFALPPDALYLQGYGDWGGGDFGLRLRHHEATGWNLPRSISEDPLVECLLRCQSTLLLREFGDHEVVRLFDGGTALLVRDADTEILVRSTAAGAAIELGRDGGWIATIRVTDWFRDESGRPVCPRVIIVKGRQDRFRAEIKVISYQTAPAPPAELDAAFEQKFSRG